MLEALPLQSPLVLLIISFVLGAFLGIRREMEAQSSPSHRSFMGMRTMILLMVLGTISTFFPAIPWLPAVSFAGVIMLVGIAYAHGAFGMNRIGITTETSAIITYLCGLLVGYGYLLPATALVILIGSLNSFRDELHSFVESLTLPEWRGALQLLILSAMVLPFLPQTPIDSWGVFVPFKAWLVVILILGIEFIGYFLIKYFGAAGGIPVVSFLGSIVSSTAVTTSLAAQAKRSTERSTIFAAGIMIGLATMQSRVALVIYGLAFDIIPVAYLLIPLGLSVGCGIVGAYYLRRATVEPIETPKEADVSLQSPFELIPALEFGAIFVIVLFALAVGRQYLGDAGVYGAAALSGVVDIDAIVFSSIESIRLGEFPVVLATNAITLALFVNTFVKIAYTAFLGPRTLTRQVAIGATLAGSFGGLVAFAVSTQLL